MNANCGGRVRLYKRTAAGSETELTGSPWNDGVEFGTSRAAMNWVFTPTSMSFDEDDRLVVRVFLTNVGTMAGGFTCSWSYDGPTAAADGDSYITLNETVLFKDNDPWQVYIHFDGIYASTTIPASGDASPQWGNMAVQGNAQLDTAQFVFGTASALFDGTGDYLQNAGSSAQIRAPWLCFGTEVPFTIDMRVRFASVSGTQGIWVGTANTAIKSIQFYQDAGVIKINDGNATIITGTATISTNTWYHVAVTCDSSRNLRLFVDGTQDGSTFDASSLDFSVSFATFVEPIWASNSGGSNFLNGWIEEWHADIGLARWTANFTPPTQEYPLPDVTESLVFDPRSYFNNVLAVR